MLQIAIRLIWIRENERRVNIGLERHKYGLNVIT